MKLDIIYNEDFLKGIRRLPGKSVNLIIADPPYNIGKADWDKIPDYIDWSGKWMLECQRVLKDNGSFYWFHNDMPTISRLMVWLEENSKFIFKQFIVWNKKFKGCNNEGYLQGYNEVEELRNYQRMVEYLLFYTFQDDTGLNKIINTPSLWKSIKDYFVSEFNKSGMTIKRANELMGYATTGSSVAGGLFLAKKKEFVFPTERAWLALQTTGYFQREYESLWLEYERLRLEYEGLRLEYEDLRYTFNNQKTHHSVWNYEIAEKNGHITPKSIPLIENILKHSSNEEDIVLIPFVGGGNDCIACKRLNRKYIGYEINKEYCKIAEQGLEAEKTLWD